MSDARLVGHVLELSLAEVAIQCAARRARILRRLDGQRIDEVEIGQPVVVEIEQRHAAAHRFDDVFLLGRGVVLKRNTRFAGEISEQDLGRWLCRQHCRCRDHAAEAARRCR